MNDKTNNTTLMADNLRRSIDNKKIRRAEESVHRRDEADRQLEEMFRQFLTEKITQKELDSIRAKIISAAEREEYQVEVMRFPSKLTSDRGRAINNQKPGWPETLPGKARDFYEFFLERGSQQGFKLKAQIVDWPDGKPGNVGLSVSWE